MVALKNVSWKQPPHWYICALFPYGSFLDNCADEYVYENIQNEVTNQSSVLLEHAEILVPLTFHNCFLINSDAMPIHWCEAEDNSIGLLGVIFVLIDIANPDFKIPKEVNAEEILEKHKKKEVIFDTNSLILIDPLMVGYSEYCNGESDALRIQCIYNKILAMGGFHKTSDGDTYLALYLFGRD